MAARKKSQDTVETAADEAPPNIEELLSRIDTIVARLEDETAPLDTAIRDFEDGMALTRQAQALLQAAEQRVQVLLEEDPETADADDDALG